MTWQLATAKNRFSEVVSKALTEGPQHVRRRNQTVVVIAEDHYKRLIGTRPGFKEYLASGPGFGRLQLKRDARRRIPDSSGPKSSYL